MLTFAKTKQTMETKHTKGEWIAINALSLSNNGRGIYIQTTESNICTINTNSEVDEANAKLIAAAPDLLEALIEAKNVILKINPSNLSEKQLTENAVKNGAWYKIVNAIKKATE